MGDGAGYDGVVRALAALSYATEHLGGVRAGPLSGDQNSISRRSVTGRAWQPRM